MTDLLARRVLPAMPAYFQAVAGVAAQGLADTDLALMRLSLVFDPYAHEKLRAALETANPRMETDRTLIAAMRDLCDRWQCDP